MSSKFFVIPFLSVSSDSDFICPDGEVLTPLDQLGLPPVPEIEFGLVRTTLPGWHINPDVYPAKHVVAKNPTMEYWTKSAAELLSRFQAEATWHRLFVAPFKVLAAWKLTDGRYVSASEPMTLTPNSDTPIVAVFDDTDSSPLEFRIAGAVCSLYYKLRAPEVLRDWVGKITDLVILTSSPLQRYDSYESFLPVPGATSDAWCENLDIDSGQITRSRICSDTLPLAWKANCKPMASVKYRPFISIPLRDVDLAYKWTSSLSSPSVPENFTEEWKHDDLMAMSLPSKKANKIIINGEDKEIFIETRPLKLSGAGDFKRVRKVYLRGNFSADAISLKVFGSRDMQKWWLIAETEGSAVATLPISCFRFYRVTISGFLSTGESLQGLILTGSSK